MEPIRFTFTDVSGKRPRFEVTVHYADGRVVAVGQVEHRWIRHLLMEGWQATAADGSHRSVHHERWEAAWACAWDGRGIYPFPVNPRYRAVVEG